MFRLSSVERKENLSHLRWTVDEKADLRFVREIYKRLYNERIVFLMADILKVLHNEPYLKEINKKIGQKNLKNENSFFYQKQWLIKGSRILKEIKNKIALGSAQFGMDYGINNKRGQIPKKEVFQILDNASRSGIGMIDTAYTYGESETIIGGFIQKNSRNFKIVSKLPKCNIEEIEGIFKTTLKRLNTDKIYGYMIHNFQDFLDSPSIWYFLEALKLKGKVEKIGFSIYFPWELEYIFKNKLKIDIIQLPYSVFDQRFVDYFPRLESLKIDIHARSVFLQGLVFKKPEELGAYFAKFRNKIAKLRLLSKQLKIPIAGICLNFALLNRLINKVIVGVDNIDNFKGIINSLKYIAQVGGILDRLIELREYDENIIIPFKWQVSPDIRNL
jgi:aryl-alcohol dehydrogenase-like predicted oxidoreductase